MSTKTIIVPLRFEGAAEVQVPADMADDLALKVAEAKALACVLATFDNMDSDTAQVDAIDELVVEEALHEETADDVWESIVPLGCSGSWTAHKWPEVVEP